MTQAIDALTDVSAKRGEVVGRVKLSVGRSAVPFVILPVLPTFRTRHPRVDVEIVVEERLVDLVGEGYDAGVRLTESTDRDMVQVRLTDELRFVIVATPEYLAKHGTPRKPEDLLRHECIGYTILETTKLHAIDPAAYLHAAIVAADRGDLLLPWQFAPPRHAAV